MRRRLKMDVLKPAPSGGGRMVHESSSSPVEALTRWYGTRHRRQRGAAGLSRLGYVLRWEDGPPGREGEDATRAIRRYHLTSRYLEQAIRRTDEVRGLPDRSFNWWRCPRGQGADSLSDLDRTNLRDAVWWLLSRSGEALDAID